MITLLPQGYQKILTLFYNNKEKAIHLREIARQTQLGEPSTHRILNKLEEQHILTSKKEGNQKQYSIQHNTQTHTYFQEIDQQRFATLPHIRKKAIQTYMQELNEQPIHALLFGSTAKNTHTEESDIDILLITNKAIHTQEAENTTEALTGIRISTFQIPYKEFLREKKLCEDNVIQSAIHTGYPIRNHTHYYQTYYNE